MNVLSVWSKMNEWSSSLKNFLLNNSDKAVVIYTGLFLLGLAIFALVFSALNKDQ